MLMMKKRKNLNSRTVEGNEMVMGLSVSQKSGADLMQNCDLPPPIKVVAGSDETVIECMRRVCGIMGQKDQKNDEEFSMSENGDENEKLELFKALRLSQTRAREAERKREEMAKERDYVAQALLKESSHLFAYRQWMRLLELQVSILQSHREKDSSGCGCVGAKMVRKKGSEEENGELGNVTFLVALALCLGVAGVGFAFGCRYLF